MHHLLIGAGALACAALMVGAGVAWRLMGPKVAGSSPVSIGGTALVAEHTQILAVVTRLDGRVEDLGVVASSFTPKPGTSPALKHIGA